MLQTLNDQTHQLTSVFKKIFLGGGICLFWFDITKKLVFNHFLSITANMRTEVYPENQEWPCSRLRG